MARRTPPQPTPSERRWAYVYNALIKRYVQLPLEQSVPIVAVRLYTLRVGLSTMLRQLTDTSVGDVAAACRHELTRREEFLAHMIATYPPENPEQYEGATEELAEDLALIDGDPAVMLRLLLFLDRLRTREINRAANNGTVH